MISKRTAPALVALTLLVACGESPSGGGTSGTGTPDGGQHGGPDAILSPQLPADPRRGPIALSFGVIDPDHDIGGYRLERQDGDAWVPATTLALEAAADRVEVLWDSFADVNDDARVSLRLAATDPKGDVNAPFELEVRNAPDADRLVIVGNPYVEDDSGAAVEKGHSATVFLWNGFEPGVVGAPRVLDVGVGPTILRAAPHGRATAVLEDAAGTVSLLLTPLDAIVANVTRSSPIALPYGTPSDVRWSGDGRHLLVLGSRDGEQPPAIWVFTPSEDLTDIGQPAAVATLPGPPSAFDVDAKTGRMLVFCGSGGSGKDKLLWLGPDGSELARLEDDFAPPNSLALAPAGDFALVASSFFGDDLRAYALTPTSLTQAGPTVTTVLSPESVVFHPASPAGSPVALVTQLEHNRVSSLKISGSGITAGAPVAGFPLAGEVDVIQRGSQAGTALVTGVSTANDHPVVTRADFSVDGAVTARGTALDLGTGTDRLPQGIAIQR